MTTFNPTLVLNTGQVGDVGAAVNPAVQAIAAAINTTDAKLGLSARGFIPAFTATPGGGWIPLGAPDNTSCFTRPAGVTDAWQLNAGKSGLYLLWLTLTASTDSAATRLAISMLNRGVGNLEDYNYYRMPDANETMTICRPTYLPEGALVALYTAPSASTDFVSGNLELVKWPI